MCAPVSPSDTALFVRRHPSIRTPTRRGYRSIYNWEKFPPKKRNARLPPFSTKKKQTTEIATQGRTRDGGGGGGQGCSCCRPCAQKKVPHTGEALWRVRTCGEPTSWRRASTRAIEQHSSWCATARASAKARHMVQEVPCHFGKGITRQEAALRTQVVGLWRVRFPPCLVRPGGRLPVQ